MTAATVKKVVQDAPLVPVAVVAPVVTGDRAASRKLEHMLVSSLGEADEAFDDELVEGVIGREVMAVIYGDSNSGKTFLAIDLAARMNLAEDWLGRHTVGGVVLYLATEAAASVRLRFKAWRRVHGQVPPGVVIVQSPINLFDNRADTAAVISLVGEVEKQLQQRVTLIVGDTLARMSSGANENSGEDMGVVIANADRIRAETGATFLWIHHCGKNAAMGMRGWSGMRAFIDTEIEVTADEATGLRTAEITKQRDLPGKGDRLGFRLRPVTMGLNRWGNERTSCIVESVEAPPRPQQGKRQSEVAGAITELLNSRAGMKKGDIVKHYAERYERATVYRELKKMLESGRLYEVAGIYTLRSALKTEASS